MKPRAIAVIGPPTLLAFFEHGEATQWDAPHMQNFKDGCAFVDVAHPVSKKKPIVALKAGATAAGTKPAASHTAAPASDDNKVYDEVLREAGMARARELGELLLFARCLPVLPTHIGENAVIITGADGALLLSDACYISGLHLMAMPDDLNVALLKFIPPVGGAGNPVDITDGEPLETYRKTVALGVADEHIHALAVGYWHTNVTRRMVCESDRPRSWPSSALKAILGNSRSPTSRRGRHPRLPVCGDRLNLHGDNECG